MKLQNSAANYIPPTPTIRRMQSASKACRGCDLWKNATQTVFGEGALKARLMFVGEQPGDQEDLQGHPFVGPAGRILDRALSEAGISRDEVYVTNAVKHFKSEPRGKRRIHKKPNTAEVEACRPWLEAEIRAVRPEIVVCLGATAAQSLLGRDFKVMTSRGKMIPFPLAHFAVATVHPSSILRMGDDESRHSAMHDFVKDLKLVRAWLDRQRPLKTGT
jgi:uracil-DNA glycosylase family protein